MDDSDTETDRPSNASDKADDETEPTPIYAGLDLRTALTYTGIFLFFAGLLLGLFTALSCTSEVLGQAMTFATDIPADQSVSEYLQVLFKTCFITGIVKPRLLITSSGMSGLLTLTIFTWYNSEMSFSDWLGI